LEKRKVLFTTPGVWKRGEGGSMPPKNLVTTGCGQKIETVNLKVWRVIEQVTKGGDT